MAEMAYASEVAVDFGMMAGSTLCVSEPEPINMDRLGLVAEGVYALNTNPMDPLSGVADAGV